MNTESSGRHPLILAQEQERELLLLRECVQILPFISSLHCLAPKLPSNPMVVATATVEATGTHRRQTSEGGEVSSVPRSCSLKARAKPSYFSSFFLCPPPFGAGYDTIMEVVWFLAGRPKGEPPVIEK